MNLQKTGMSLLAAGFLLAGCGSSDNASLSKFSLAVTDAPTDGATSVVVEFTGIELKPVEGSPVTYDLDAPRQIDLLDFQGTSAATLFSNIDIAAGDYNWMRLKVNAAQQTIDSYIEFDTGEQYSLYVPSGSTSGLQWNQGFTAPANGAVDFTIDFDLKRSVHTQGNSSDDFVLRPVIRVVDNTEVGSISGTIDPLLVTDETCGETQAVYLYELGVEPDDVGSAVEPQTTAFVSTNVDGDYVYTLGFILPGEYTIAFTCQASADMPDTDDDVIFVGAQDVVVSTEVNTVANF
ncbi:MAG: DUF4382 domain-containing protein [Gammaproteobacteria bacterium]|nr:DUF4382 domain-containing protein [Gammaproteobacteria bacterium]